MWEHPCVVSLCLIFFGVRAAFSMDFCHLFPQCMLAIIPLIAGVHWILSSASPMPCCCYCPVRGRVFSLVRVGVEAPRFFSELCLWSLV